MKDLKQNEADESQTEGDETQWRAMQYVLGEMSDKESKLFESVMSEDVALCETVLMATRLSAGIVLACESQQSAQATAVCVTRVESPALPDRPVFARFPVFMAAAAMVLAVFFMVTPGTSSRRAARASHDDAVADALALLLNSVPSNDMNPDFDESLDSEDSISSLVVPDWLLTAVDLDAAALSEDRQENGSGDESGVY